jgi:hypothetical protein
LLGHPNHSLNDTVQALASSRAVLGLNLRQQPGRNGALVCSAGLGKGAGECSRPQKKAERWQKILLIGLHQLR